MPKKRWSTRLAPGRDHSGTAGEIKSERAGEIKSVQLGDIVGIRTEQEGFDDLANQRIADDKDRRGFPQHPPARVHHGNERHWESGRCKGADIGHEAQDRRQGSPESRAWNADRPQSTAVRPGPSQPRPSARAAATPVAVFGIYPGRHSQRLFPMAISH